MDDVEVEGAGACSPASATDEMVDSQPDYSSEFLILETKQQDARSGSISEPVSIAEFKSKCAVYLEMAKSEDGVARKVAEIPPGPVRDFGLTEMLGISIAELKTVRKECR